MHVCHGPAGTCESQKWNQIPLELESQAYKQPDVGSGTEL